MNCRNFLFQFGSPRTAIGFLGFVASIVFVGCNSEKSDWHHLDLEKDGVFGVSTDRAYQELLKGKTATPVILAIMDSGFDTDHEDLRTKLWVNTGEIPGNGIDDDGNGYIDDIHGWNFTGSSTESVDNGTAILTCLVVRDQERFQSIDYSNIPERDRKDLETYQKNKTELEKKRREAVDHLARIEKLKTAIDQMLQNIGKDKPALKDIQAHAPKNAEQNMARSFLNVKMQRKTFEEVYEEDIQDMLERYQDQLAYSYNIDYIPPALDQDHPHNLLGTEYGNGGLVGSYPKHGTHVAGIAVADRQNNIGIRGVADQVQLMPILFSTLDGRERERTAAKAIRYAVDHGAKIINMSFGDEYSWDRSIVDEAVKYAMEKDVLFIHAAGNQSKDLDQLFLYPNRHYEDGGRADAWITVGASDLQNDETLRASFSNYGKTTVDLFAPGVRINSTMPGSTYKRQDGTSMAAPIVAGIAAMIRSYYPHLTALQTKEILMQSVIQAKPLTDRCVSGGVVNAYRALQLAEKYK